MYLCVLCGSQNKQPLFPYTTLTDWFLLPRQRVFTARYGLGIYMQCSIISVFNAISEVHCVRYTRQVNIIRVIEIVHKVRRGWIELG